MSGFMGGAGFGPSDGGGGGSGSIMRELTIDDFDHTQLPYALPHAAVENKYGNGYVVSAYSAGGTNAASTAAGLFILGPVASSTAKGELHVLSGQEVDFDGYSLAVAYWATE